MWLYARPGNQMARGKSGGRPLRKGWWWWMVETVVVEVSRLQLVAILYLWVLGRKWRTRSYTTVLEVFKENRSKIEKFSPIKCEHFIFVFVCNEINTWTIEYNIHGLFVANIILILLHWNLVTARPKRLYFVELYGVKLVQPWKIRKY